MKDQTEAEIEEQMKPENAPNWVHCNRCGAKRNLAVDRKFFLLSCKHIVCEKCKRSDGICPLCQARTGWYEIGPKMPEQFRFLFQDPGEVLRKHTNLMKRAIDVDTVQQQIHQEWRDNERKVFGQKIRVVVDAEKKAKEQASNRAKEQKEFQATSERMRKKGNHIVKTFLEKKAEASEVKEKLMSKNCPKEVVTLSELEANFEELLNKVQSSSAKDQRSNVKNPGSSAKAQDPSKFN